MKRKREEDNSVGCRGEGMKCVRALSASERFELFERQG